MRACVLAVLAVAFVQPAFAREHSNKAHKAHHAARHHAHQHVASHQRYRRHARVARASETPIISGYSMPQSFARTDASDTPMQAQTWSPSSSSAQVSAYAPVRRERGARASRDPALDAMIARHAAANGLPVELVHRVVTRESGYNPRARNGGALGLMQIKHATARGVGYTGSASGLFDAETNLTYAVRYLAGAYKVAGGNPNRAVALYASGYHGRGVALARRARPEVVAENWRMQAAPASMRDGVTRDDVGTVRKPRRRHR